jgi:hypothetical protein
MYLYAINLNLFPLRSVRAAPDPALDCNQVMLHDLSLPGPRGLGDLFAPILCVSVHKYKVVPSPREQKSRLKETIITNYDNHYSLQACSYPVLNCYVFCGIGLRDSVTR